MSDANNDLKYAECDFCGQERKCFIQYDLGEEHAVCENCLLMAARD